MAEYDSNHYSEFERRQAQNIGETLVNAATRFEHSTRITITLQEKPSPNQAVRQSYLTYGEVRPTGLLWSSASIEGHVIYDLLSLTRLQKAQEVIASAAK